MKQNLKRISCLLMAVVLSVSLIAVGAPSASAATYTDYYDTVSVSFWDERFNSVVLNEYTAEGAWNLLNSCMSAAGIGAVNGRQALENAAFRFNAYMANLAIDPLNLIFFGASLPFLTCNAVVRFDATYGVWRLYDKGTGYWLVNYFGQFPYYCESAAAVPDDYKEVIAESTTKDKWLDFSTATNSKRVSVISRGVMDNLALTLNETDRTCSVRQTLVNGEWFWVVADNSANIYGNVDSLPYVAHYEATVTDEKFNYIVNDGDSIDNSTTIDNSQVIDMSNGTFNYIDESGKQEFFVDELVYDFSSQSYSADTYNVTYDNDVYNTYNYTWNITYNITNTYVTNIGQSELYEPLELYYELPDGRSSADLTAEEVAGMSFEFADCVNYAKSATDTYLRALYHFDGNTDDSSYFSTQGKFEWLSGASISYMDVGTFDGALYLGPESHSMKITLPSNIGSGDFSLQFRYYQAGEADTASNIENTLSIGGTTVLKWDEASLYNGSDTALTSLAIGTWQELAVMRHNGTLYLYHNGITVGSSVNASVWTGEIVLTFGATSRAYSMLDELRVINFSAAENGSSYTCTSVPYDTNTVLVLPDSEFPIADEYWEIKSSHTNMLAQFGLHDWTNSSALLSSYYRAVTSSNALGTIGAESSDFKAYPYFCLPDFVTVSSVDGTALSTTASAEYKSTYFTGGYASGRLMPNGLFTTIAYGYYRENYEDLSSRYVLARGATYTFSMVASDGTVGSYTFTVDGFSKMTTASSSDDGKWVSYVDFNGYRIGIVSYRTYSLYSICSYGLAVIPMPADGATPTTSTKATGGEFIYLELVQGDTTDLSAEYITCMYSSEEVKPNTAAIQTDIPINGYTVGGVRPTFPTRGDVWMPVTGNRISAVYVYNGSAWESVNARWYTGTRWIPIYAFDITTLEDCWDIADIDNVVVQIGTESEFWNWWKKAWLDFRSWFEKNGTGGGTTITDESVDNILHDVDIDINVDADTGESLLDDTDFTLFDLGKSVVQGTWKVVKGVVRTGVGGIVGIVTTISHAGDFFDFYQPDSEMFHVVNYGGDDIWN